MIGPMPRWEPDGRDRLIRAALDLFAEQGYDSTTVAQIAERAGLTRSTFFRHFPDKRDVLLAGQHTLSRRFEQGIASAPPDAPPLQAVAAGLDAALAAFAERREFSIKMEAVVAANAELQEGVSLKQAGFAGAISDALRQRGVPEMTARLAAEMGVVAFRTAHARWTAPGNRKEIGELGREALDELRAATASLG
jgi:AcrR family transcriptional regulator